MHLMLYYALAVAPLSEAYLLADNVEQAHEHAVRALALCQAHKEEGHHAWVLRLLGDIAVRREPPDAEEAAACHQAAQARARALGMRPLLAHCHLGLGCLYCQQGQSTLAGHELVTAIELYRTLDMGFWQQQAAIALARVGTCSAPDTCHSVAYPKRTLHAPITHPERTSLAMALLHFLPSYTPTILLLLHTTGNQEEL